ncbi:MAG: hypothetical protein RL135_649 [Bacteroidota bacterium]|jgi:hypothetical protein
MLRKGYPEAFITEHLRLLYAATLKPGYYIVSCGKIFAEHLILQKNYQGESIYELLYGM